MGVVCQMFPVTIIYISSTQMQHSQTKVSGTFMHVSSRDCLIYVSLETFEQTHTHNISPGYVFIVSCECFYLFSNLRKQNDHYSKM